MKEKTMQTICGKIRMKTLLVFFVVLIASLWAVNSLAGDDSEENASQEVLARLQLSPAVKAKVDAIFAEYKGQIEARAKALDEAYGKAMDAAFAKAANKGSEDAVKTAKAEWDTATKLYSTTIRERDAKVKQALPPASAAKFARGMTLATERNEKCRAVFNESFAKMRENATQEETKKIQEEANEKLDAIYNDYNKKLDAEVGRVIEQK